MKDGTLLMNLPGVKSILDVANYEGWSRIESLSFAISPKESSTTSYQSSVTIVRMFDESSLQIMDLVASKSSGDCTINVVETIQKFTSSDDGRSQSCLFDGHNDVIKYKFKDARVVNYNSEITEFSKVKETIVLTYSSLECTFSPKYNEKFKSKEKEYHFSNSSYKTNNL